MQFTIPLYVCTQREGSGPTRHVVRPLFFPGPVRIDEDLSRAQQRLVGDLQQHLLKIGRDLRHEWLAAWNFCPAIEQHRVDLLLDLRRRTVRGRYFFAVFPALDRKIGFCPNLPHVWFEILRNQTLSDRAGASLTSYFRKLEQEADEETDVRPEDFALNGTAWVTSIELDVNIVQSFKDPAQKLLAMLGSADVADGAEELRNCGRCLNWLYPSGLDRAFLRDREVNELQRRMLSADHRPVLLLGRRLSGKTAVVHEYVSRITSRRQSPYAARGNVWLLSPQRLVSGMSYVGQWESRLLAILKEARKRNHVLYFDDLPGLLQAGKSRDASLSMAQVLRPFLERREVRVLAEITPEAWRILRERDRALADLFDLLPIAESDVETTARIVLSARRLLEQEFRCQFALETLPTILEIEKRYSAESAFPGKAVRFMKDVALIRRGVDVTRDHVLDEFQRRSGLATRFLDPRQRLQRQEIVNALSAEVVGQPEPVAAVADILSIAKARLNDTGRPMGSLLFVGPTGVGKTQLARAAARFLFGDPNRLLRFDLNEYITRGSATRLVGTFEEPDGLLTGAVRRQPFAVVLLDEIEKAHPEVFDVLLQVLGEGRLSDGQGRTVSFTNTLIIMTSNLGVRENSQRLGFAGDAPAGDHVWQKAAERFFRPEFFNRIDRIVPFQRLSRQVIEQVARVLLNEMLLRDGLARRRCILTIEPHALDRAVEVGYSPTLGARALKRSLEQLLIQPAGRHLAALKPETLTQLHLYPAPEGIAVQVQALRDALPEPNCVAQSTLPAVKWAREAMGRFVHRVESTIAAYRPEGPVSAGRVTDRHRAYYLIQERCRRLTQVADLLADVAQAAMLSNEISPLPSGSFRHARKVTSHRPDTPSSFWSNMAREEGDVASFHQSLRELFDQASTVKDADAALLGLLLEAALTEAELKILSQPQQGRIGLCIRALDGQTAAAQELALRIQTVFTEPVKPDAMDLGLDCAVVSGKGQSESLLELSGLAAASIAESEAGVHLDYCSESQVRVLQVIPIPVEPGVSVVDAWELIRSQRQDWLSGVSRGVASVTDDPLKPTSVIRIYESFGLTLDLRTGEMTEGMPDAAAWRRFLLGSFPLPDELRPAAATH